jgi:hypothetical protein
MSAIPNPLLSDIMASLQARYIALNRHYEAGWTDSWCHRRCEHAHQMLIDAAKCAQPHGAGWCVFCVEYGSARQLTDDEDRKVNEFRFAGLS